MKKIIIIGAALLLCIAIAFIAITRSGGSSSITANNELVGSWVGTGNEHATVTFKNDGTFTDKGNGKDADMSGTYTIDETNKVVVCTEKDYGLVFRYNYTISGNDLTLQMDIGLPRTFSK